MRNANARHCCRTGHPAQIAFARATCDPDGPDDEIGKNRSGSANWQAAKERQCSPGTSSPITRWLVRDIASASAPRSLSTSSRPASSAVTWHLGRRERCPGSVASPDAMPRPTPVDAQPMSATCGEHLRRDPRLVPGRLGTPPPAGACRRAQRRGGEWDLFGGERSYWACIPSKAMLRPVAAVAGARRVAGARQAVTGRWILRGLARRDGWVTGWNDEGQAAGLKGIGAELIRGRAAGRPPPGRRGHPGRRDGGSDRPARGRDLHRHRPCPNWPAWPRPTWTNRHATGSRTVPGRLAIVVGGGVGVEMASAWQG